MRRGDHYGFTTDALTGLRVLSDSERRRLHDLERDALIDALGWAPEVHTISDRYVATNGEMHAYLAQDGKVSRF